MSLKLETYYSIRRELLTYYFALEKADFDSATQSSITNLEERSEFIKVITQKLFELENSDKFKHLVESLLDREDIAPELKHELCVLKRKINKNYLVPPELLADFESSKLICENKWKIAKQESDFSIVLEPFKNLINMRKEISFFDTNNNSFDSILKSREINMGQTKYDNIFSQIYSELNNLYLSINSDSKTNIMLPQISVIKQKEFVNYLLKILKFDLNNGDIAETEHPFMSSLGSNNVRLALRYYESNFLTTIFTSIHEAGHGIYEQQSNPKLNDTFSWGGASTVLHESQAKLYENNFGKSYNFWLANFENLKRAYNLPKTLTIDSYYKAINFVDKRASRINSDELSFLIHIMLRYEFEKNIFSNNEKIENLPQVWNELHYKHFGFYEDNASKGILQDGHWFQGNFGYFPTYILGSICASQIFDAMEQQINVSDLLLVNDFEKINYWLKQKIHYYGATAEGDTIFENAVGSELEVSHHIKYLQKKYKSLYNQNR